LAVDAKAMVNAAMQTEKPTADDLSMVMKTEKLRYADAKAEQRPARLRSPNSLSALSECQGAWLK
jgi:hypothetical protein